MAEIKAVVLGGVNSRGIYHDTNGDRVVDSRDELIAIVQGVTVPPEAFVYV
jgi:hypothetical protein